MKRWMKRVTLIILAVILLPWPWTGFKPERASAAGEIIEYNPISVPERTYTATRPASIYSEDPNWYASTMYATFPANTFTVKWDQVRKFLYVDMANSYMPTRWEMFREPLGGQPKNPNSNRAYHGYSSLWTQNMELVYKDGTVEMLSNIGTGYGGPVYTNGNLSGYENPLGDSYNITYSPMSYHPIIPVDWPPYYTKDYFSKPIIPHSEFILNEDKVPAYIRLKVDLSELYVTGGTMNYTLTPYYPYTIGDWLIIPLTTNKKPNLTLTSQAGQTVMNEEGFNTFNLEGYVQDPDNDTVDVVAEIPNLYYKKFTLQNTGSPKNFSIPIDAIAESLPLGTHTVHVKVIDPFGLKAEASTSFNVIKRLKNKNYFLVNEAVSISGTYSDNENDPKVAERYKYEHDPTFFDNPMGMISDSGLWRGSKYTSFPYSGAYTASFQNRDSPKTDDRFDEFRMWSKENLSSMTFLVHRKPVALFSAKLLNGSVAITDQSYDTDHISAPKKGLVTWQWQYKLSSSEVWNDGLLTSLPSNDQYDLRLRVRDVDGLNGIGTWSDWYQVTVGSGINHPPVALFTVVPNNVSYRKSTVITDSSFDPDNDPLDIYYWTIVKDGWNQVWASWGGAVTPPNIAAYGVGDYQVNLQVHDNRGLWSTTYSQNVKVFNTPPVPAFNMPSEVYRDTVITMENMTPDPDADGDNLIYQWNTRLNSGNYYYAGSNRNQNITIKNLLAQSGITQQQAISDGWEMRLTASDGSLSSSATRLFSVKNHVPSAAIIGSTDAVQYNSYTYASNDMDEDTSDQSSLDYYWKVTDSDSKIKMLYTKNIGMTFDEPGVYTLEHWAVDQIGDKSNVAVLKVTVAPNLAPSITLTTPAGTKAVPTILDAELQGDPLISWTYSDPENDPQEKYRLEFYTNDGLLTKTVENSDPTGALRQYQVPNPTFERFALFSLYARAYSKNSWSQISNEKAFIIDNPPHAGFTLRTDTGRNAAAVPIYRTDVLQIHSTATDADIQSGDSLKYQYFLKPASGAEGLASAQESFTKQFVTNGTFTLRQVVTDSLGLYRELSQLITVVNRIPTVSITYPTSTNPSSPTIASTLTPVVKWDYQDEDGDVQQRFKVRILNLASGVVKAQSGEQVSGTHEWQIPAGALVENEKYAVEVEVYDGYGWSSVSPRKYVMVNLLSISGAARHTEEWNSNREAYNLSKSGNAETPRGYNVFWAGEKFVLQGTATGLPDTVLVTMTGGYAALLSPVNVGRTLWTGELADPQFERLPDGPVTFTFTATNEYNTKVDTVTITILEDWTEYYRSHRVK